MGIFFKVGADFSKLQQLRTDIEKLKTSLSGMKKEADPTAYKALEKQLARTQSEFNKLSEKAAKTQLELEKARQKTEQTTREMGSLQSMLLKIGGTAALIGLGKQIIDITGQFEQLNVAFSTILKSKEKADKLMADVVEFAATTPFQLTDTAAATKQLLAYGFAADGVIGNLRMLGNVASGVSAPIGDLVYLYGTLQTQGRAYTRDIMQFTSRGIPIIDELAKVMNVAKSEVKDLVEAGKIGFPEVEKAFQNLTKEGGMFFNLMENQSKTITGQISNLRDNIDKAMNDIGSANSGLIKDGIAGLNYLIANYEPLLDILKVLVVTYGSYRAALMLAVAAQKLSLLATQIQEYYAMAKALGVATANHIAFNTAAKANPYGLILAGLAAVVSALIVFGKKTGDASGVTSDFKKNMNDASAEAKKLFNAIKNTKSGTEQHAQAIKAVNDKYRDYLPNLLTEKSSLKDIKTAYDAVTESMARSIAFKAQQDQLSGLETNTDEAAKTFYLSIDKASGKMTDAQKGQIKALVEQYKDQVKAEFDKTGVMSDTFSIDLYKIFNDVSGESIGTQAAYRIKTAIIDLIESEKELDKQTTGLKTTYESYLSALGLTGQSSDDSNKALKTVSEQIANTTQAITDAESKLASMRSPGSTSTAKDIEEQVKTVGELRKQLETLTGVKEKATAEIKDIGGQISDLYKQLETADEKDRSIIAARIIELQKEKVLREQIAENAVKAVRNEAAPTAIPAKKQNIFLGNVETIKGVTGELDKLNKKIEETKKKAASMAGVVDPEKFKQFLSYTQEALFAVGAITDEYAEQLELNEDQAQVLQDGLKTMSGIADIASGNFIQGGAKIVSSFLKYILPQQKTLAEHFENVANNIEKVAKSIDLASETLSSLGIDSSYRSLRSLQNELQNVAESAKDLNKELGTTQYGHRRDSYSTINKVMEQRADLEKEIEALSQRLLKGNLSDDQRKAIEAVLESYNSVLDQIDGMISDLIGTSVSDLNNSLVDAFFDSEDAAEAWGKTVNDIIANITKKQLVAKFLTEPVNEAIDQLVKDYADSNLSVDELQKFKDAMDEVYQSAAPAIEQAIDSLKQAGLFPEDDTSQQASSRGFQTMSQDTGDALEGRFAVVQMAVVDTAQKMSIENKNSENMLVYQMKISDQLQQQIDTFGEIKQIQIASMYHLEDIAKYTKVLPGMAEDIKQVKDNTANL